jgi:hypothetical protein
MDNIKMDIKDIGLKGVECSRLVEDSVNWAAVLDAVLSLRVP